MEESSVSGSGQVLMPLNKVFGVIKTKKCFENTIKLNDEKGLLLELGTLIQIISDDGANLCYFKVRDFTNWQDKFKTTIYKCGKDDFICVSAKLWPYLLAINDNKVRIKFVENVDSRKFDMDMLKLGNEIRIRGQPRSKAKYQAFVIRHIGVMQDIGAGYYIGLQLKNENDTLISSLKLLSRYYRFGGTGIVVSADWIMLNIYNEEKSQTNQSIDKSREINNVSNIPPTSPDQYVGWNVPTSKISITEKCSYPKVKALELSERHVNISEKPRRNSIILTDAANLNPTHTSENNHSSSIPFGNLTEINDANVISRCSDSCENTKPLLYTTEIELLNNVDGSVKNVEITKCDTCDKTVEIGYGFILRECLHTFCSRCIRDYVKQNSNNSGIRCPFNKNYECQFDLLDAEIRDLGGDFVYDKILKNRLKEYIDTDPTARVCLNKDCKYVWFEKAMNKQIKNPRCPMCKENWHTICNNEREQNNKSKKSKSTNQSKSEKTKQKAKMSAQIKNRSFPSENLCEKTHTNPPHPGYTAEIEKINNNNGSVKDVGKTKCDKCDKIVDIGHGIILRECLHTFCLQCIRGHVELNSKYDQIGCPYSKAYECKFNLLDDEIKDLGGELVYNNILDNRLKEFIATDPNARICKNKNCKYVWISALNLEANYERCPKCKKNWCNICSSVHEPSEEHGNKSDKTIQGTNEADKSVVLCCCKPSNLNCYITLKCKHNFCRTFLMGILEEQLRSISRAACPSCFQEIDNSQKQHIVDKMNRGHVKICHMCYNQADAQLTLCRHSFCYKCVRDMIADQESDPSITFINCTICNNPISELDISQYGSRKTLGPFKTEVRGTSKKIEVAMEVNETAPKNIETAIVIPTENNLFHCGMCLQRIPIENGRQLTECLDFFCLTCCKKYVDRQLSNSQVPACPICQKPLQPFEVDVITGKSLSQINSLQPLFECLKCEEMYEAHLIEKCTKCGCSTCQKCAKSIVLGQIENKQSPKCSFCQILLDKTQIDNIRSVVPTIKPKVQQKSHAIQPCQVSFECFICEQLIDRASQIILNECKHKICRKCLQDKISEQLRWSKTPKCPLCLIDIDQIQLDAIAIPATNNHTATRGDQIQRFSSNNTKLTDELEVSYDKTVISEQVTPFKCIVCELSAEKASQIILAKCQHEICLKCLQAIILLQKNLSKIPACPVCAERIDQIQLDSIEILTITATHNLDHLNHIQKLRSDISKEVGESQIISISRDTTTKQLEQVTIVDKSNSPQLLPVKIPFECIVCEQSFGESSQIILTRCKHEICRQCLQENVSKQQWTSTPKCPVCCENIDENQLEEIGISTTKHGAKFDEIRSSTPDSSKNAHDSQTTSHRITSFEMISLEPTKLPFKCFVCGKPANELDQIILTKCKHEICRKCLHERVANRTRWSPTIFCPACCQNIDQNQLDIFGITSITDGLSEIQKSRTSKETDEQQITIRRRSIVQMEQEIGHNELYISQPVETQFECIVCDQSADPASQIILTKCKHKICRRCLNEKIVEQTIFTSLPKCPFCMEHIDPIQLDAIGIQITNNTVSKRKVENTNYGNSKNADICYVCDEKFRQKITLTNCSHEFCRQCIQANVTEQQSNGIVPNCPICHTLIHLAQIILVNMDNRLDRNSSFEQASPKPRCHRILPDVDDKHVCLICGKMFELSAVTRLIFCEDQFCGPCISTALNDQSMVKKIPICPVCSAEVSGTDIINICGMEGFRKFMNNKRIA